MAERLSTGHANAQLADFVSDYANGVMEIYSGTQPTNADTTEVGGGTLLAIITEDGGAFTGGSSTNGLNFGTPSSGVVDKSSSETWKGTILASGVAGWFRFYSNAYTKGASTSALRFDGAISTSSTAELQMLNTTLTAGGEVTITSLPITYPRT